MFRVLCFRHVGDGITVCVSTAARFPSHSLIVFANDQVPRCPIRAASLPSSLPSTPNTEYQFHTVGGRNPAPLYLHPKTNPRTPSLTLGQCLVVRKKEVE